MNIFKNKKETKYLDKITILDVKDSNFIEKEIDVNLKIYEVEKMPYIELICSILKLTPLSTVGE
jgi:hypothetical protein